MKVFGIISDDRALKSKSPAMHNYVLRRLGISAVYVPFPVSPVRLPAALAGLAALSVSGVNVTVPYKETVMSLLDALSPEVKQIGAVNTIVNVEGRLAGHNTDAGGFAEVLRAENRAGSVKTALIFGAGGAAKAVAYTLRESGCNQVYLAARDVARTSQTARRIGCLAVDFNHLVSRPFFTDLVINATTASDQIEAPGLAELVSGLQFPGCQMVIDLNYGRRQNFWQDLAARLKAPFQDGLGLLAHQARLSFKLWTGIDPDIELFHQALQEAS